MTLRSLPEANSHRYIGVAQFELNVWLSFRGTVAQLERNIQLSGVNEIEQLVTTYYVKYYRASKDLKVEILQSLKDGMFTGKCNYAFWGPDQFDPYRNLHIYPSVEQTLHFSINGFRHNDKPDYPNDLVFWRSDNGTYFDGNGKQVTIKEIQERRNRLKH